MKLHFGKFNAVLIAAVLHFPKLFFFCLVVSRVSGADFKLNEQKWYRA